MLKHNWYLFLAVILGISWAAPARGQQFPQFSLYSNAYLFNPAVGGINNYVDVKTSFRQQFSGVEGSPVTAYFSAHKPVNQADLNKKELTDLPMRGVHQVRFVPSQRQKVRHGVGGFIFNDQAGLLDRTSGAVSYAVHVPSGRSFYASFGASIGASMFSLDDPDILINNGEVFDRQSVGSLSDPAFTNISNQLILPEINIGTWIYTPKFYFGLSALQLLGNELRFGDEGEGIDIEDARLTNHFMLSTGYRFTLGSDLGLVPNLMARYVIGIPPVIEGGVRAIYQDNIWGGIGYRFSDFTHENPEAVYVQLGLGINRLLDLAFAYDFTLSELSIESQGSFEVALGLRLLNKRNSDSRLW